MTSIGNTKIQSRDAINRMVDQAIGTGQVLLLAIVPTDNAAMAIQFRCAGSFPDEVTLAHDLGELFAAKFGHKPTEVKIAWAAGTWQEIPTWTDRWLNLQ